MSPVSSCLIRALIGLPVLLALGIGSARACVAQSLGRQVLSADEIAQAGVARLSDLLDLADAWQAYTFEGFTWHASAAGLAAPEQAGWTLLVDGQPVGLRVLGTQHLNTLPLQVSQIDSVEIISVPTLQYGVFAPAGMFHLHTRRPARGLKAQASFAAGNETGDPGPFRYTDLATRNVDRIGPTYGAEAAFGQSAGYAHLGFMTDQHHGTDVRIVRRVYDLYEGVYNPRFLLAAPNLLLGLGRTHRLFAGHTRLQDLRFFEPFGQEVPTQHSLTHVGLSGILRPGLQYQASYSVAALDHRPNQAGLNFDWQQNHLRLNVEGRFGVLGFGGGLMHQRTVSAFSLSDPIHLQPHAYAAVSVRPHRRWTQHVNIYALLDDGRPGLHLLTSGIFRLATKQTLALTASFSHRPIAAGNSLWYWIREGYAFPAQRDAVLSLPADFQDPTSLTVDVSWYVRLRRRLQLTLNGYYRRFEQQLLPAYTFHFNPDTDGFRTTAVVTASSGAVRGASLYLRHHMTRHLMQRLAYGYLQPSSVDEAFQQAWAPLSRHRMGYTLRYVPVPRLSLYAHLRYQSGSSWPAYRPAAVETAGRYLDYLPAFWLLDLTAQKRFWKDHLRASLTLRNALDEAVRLHPAGAVTRLAFHVRLQLSF